MAIKMSVTHFGDAHWRKVCFTKANFASVQQLPVIFVCENNLSVYTHLATSTNRNLVKIGEAHG